jgi:transposase
MVVDNVRYHDAKRLKPILEKYKNRLEIVYLPAYSPDLNPIERIWWYMRKK